VPDDLLEPALGPDLLPQVCVLDLQPLLHALQLAEELGALDRHRRLVGEDPQQLERLGVERLAREHAQDAQQLPAELQGVRAKGDRAVLHQSAAVVRVYVGDLPHDVVGEPRPPLARHLRRQRRDRQRHQVARAGDVEVIAGARGVVQALRAFRLEGPGRAEGATDVALVVGLVEGDPRDGGTGVLHQRRGDRAEEGGELAGRRHVAGDAAQRLQGRARRRVRGRQARPLERLGTGSFATGFHDRRAPR
jgi:hypothetical protein